MKRLKKRRGMTLVETIVALLLFSLSIGVMVTLTNLKVNEAAQIDKQYSMLAADAYLSDIYHDFHGCISYTVDSDPSTGRCAIAFNLLAGNASFYEYNAGSKWCYKNGVQMFQADAFEVNGAGGNLYVSVKLPDERVLYIDIFT